MLLGSNNLDSLDGCFWRAMDRLREWRVREVKREVKVGEGGGNRWDAEGVLKRVTDLRVRSVAMERVVDTLEVKGEGEEVDQLKGSLENLKRGLEKYREQVEGVDWLLSWSEDLEKVEWYGVILYGIGVVMEARTWHLYLLKHVLVMGGGWWHLMYRLHCYLKREWEVEVAIGEEAKGLKKEIDNKINDQIAEEEIIKDMCGRKKEIGREIRKLKEDICKVMNGGGVDERLFKEVGKVLKIGDGDGNRIKVDEKEGEAIKEGLARLMYTSRVMTVEFGAMLGVLCVYMGFGVRHYMETGMIWEDNWVVWMTFIGHLGVFIWYEVVSPGMRASVCGPIGELIERYV